MTTQSADVDFPHEMTYIICALSVYVRFSSFLFPHLAALLDSFLFVFVRIFKIFGEFGSTCGIEDSLDQGYVQARFGHTLRSRHDRVLIFKN